MRQSPQLEDNVAVRAHWKWSFLLYDAEKSVKVSHVSWNVFLASDHVDNQSKV